MSSPQNKKPSEMTKEERKVYYAAIDAKRKATIAAKKAEAEAAEKASTASSEPGSVSSEMTTRSWKEYTDEERTALRKARAAKAVVTKAIHKADEAQAEAMQLMALAQQKLEAAAKLKAEAEERRITAAAAATAAAELLARNEAAQISTPRSISPDSDSDESSKKRTLSPEHKAKMQAGRDLAGFQRVVESMMEMMEEPPVMVLAALENPFDLF